MKDKILHDAGKLFLTLGVKSVTMDDIAEKMGISKKTIYEFYANKYELVKATTNFVFESIMAQIDSVCQNKINSPIRNLFEINRIICSQIDGSEVREYQLKKYYPEIHKDIFERKLKNVVEGITENLERGVALGLYREEINIPLVARFYYNNTNALRDPEIFPSDTYKISDLMLTYLTYHIRAIATPKGIEELEKYLQENPLLSVTNQP